MVMMISRRGVCPRCRLQAPVPPHVPDDPQPAGSPAAIRFFLAARRPGMSWCIGSGGSPGDMAAPASDDAQPSRQAPAGLSGRAGGPYPFRGAGPAPGRVCIGRGPPGWGPGAPRPPDGRAPSSLSSSSSRRYRRTRPAGAGLYRGGGGIRPGIAGDHHVRGGGGASPGPAAGGAIPAIPSGKGTYLGKPKPPSPRPPSGPPAPYVWQATGCGYRSGQALPEPCDRRGRPPDPARVG